jgi:hypothetical protein
MMLNKNCFFMCTIMIFSDLTQEKNKERLLCFHSKNGRKTQNGGQPCVSIAFEKLFFYSKSKK